MVATLRPALPPDNHLFPLLQIAKETSAHASLSSDSQSRGGFALIRANIAIKLWKACWQLNSQQQPVRKLKMKLVSTFLSISFSAFGFLQNVKLNSKPTSLHVHSYLYQPH